MIDQIFKKLNIKTKPNKVFTYIFYGLSGLLILMSLSTMLSVLFGDARIFLDISPYLSAIFLFIPPIAFSFYVNSGIPKNDNAIVFMFIVSLCLLAVVTGNMILIWINKIVWFVIEMLPNYNLVLSIYPELFGPAIKTLSFVIPFIGIFKIVDYILGIYDDEDLFSAIAGFTGISINSSKKESGEFTCGVVICKEKGTNLPVILPEKKRYEATLVQGATGTGKTATVLLPMSAFDLEKKYFFREYSKKLGYSLLKKGIAYMTGPFNNEYINNNFSLKYLKPRRGMEEQYYSQIKNMIQYTDNSTGEIVYKNLGVTVVENDGGYISKFVSVAKNLGLEVYSVDPSNPERTLSINPFAIPDPAKVASIIADVLKSMYENEGGGAPGDPFFTQVTLDAFQNLAILLKEMYPVLNSGNIASLEDMLELLYNFDKVEELTEEMKKIPSLEQKYRLLIAYFEKNFYKPSLNINGYEIPGTRGSGRKDTERFLYGAITQLNNLLRHPGLKKALCGKNNILDFDKALSEGHILTACSRKGELGIIQSKAFGMFFIMQFQDAVLRRKGNEDSRTPHFLYIDEFPEYINKDMEVMFTLFRKYRCGVAIAIQNLSQLEKGGKSSTYYRQTVLANTKTQIVFGDTVPEDSEYWEKAFGKDKKPDIDHAYDLSGGKLNKKTSIKKKEKERAKAYKIQNNGFGAVYFKTKTASGKTVVGKGKTSFLDSKYSSPFPIDMFNFEKYMMSKPDIPTINLKDSNNSDDLIIGSNSSIASSLLNELKSDSANSFGGDINDDRFANANAASSAQTDDIEIVFDLESVPELENSKLDGGAITENYETPVIDKRKK